MLVRAHTHACGELTVFFRDRAKNRDDLGHHAHHQLHEVPAGGGDGVGKGLLVFGDVNENVDFPGEFCQVQRGRVASECGRVSLG